MTTPLEFLASTHDGAKKIARVSKIISAPPAQIFELLANPSTHAVIDGSGSIKSAQENAPTRLALGTKFGMRMKVGVPYKITNEVVEFDEGSRVAWRHFGGHIWLYILEAVDGGTRVTEEFDYASAKSPLFLKVMGYPDKNRKAMERTLLRMQEYFTTRA